MFLFYVTGVTPAMTEKMVGEGSQYAGAFVDAKGNTLDGSKMYTVHMPPNISAKTFWSFPLHDNQTRSMLQTDQQSPAVGSFDQGVAGPTQLVQWMFISDRRLRPTKKTTGCRPSPARDGIPSCVSTVRLSRGSTKLGGRKR